MLGGAFDEKLFLEHLTFFDDLTSFEIISIEGGEIPDSDEVKAFFEKLTVEYLSKK